MKNKYFKQIVILSIVGLLSSSLLWLGGTPSYNQIFRLLGGGEGLLLICFISFGLEVLILVEMIKTNKDSRPTIPLVIFFISIIPLILFLLWISYIILMFLKGIVIDHF